MTFDINTLPERALSIRQPWVWAILHAGKDIENRNKPCTFRGLICLHASKTRTKKSVYEDALTIAGICPDRDPPYIPYNPSHPDLIYGGIVAVAEITDCITESDNPWFFGPYGYVLANVRVIPFIPVKGELGFFRWRRNIIPA